MEDSERHPFQYAHHSPVNHQQRLLLPPLAVSRWHSHNFAEGVAPKLSCGCDIIKSCSIDDVCTECRSNTSCTTCCPAHSSSRRSLGCISASKRFSRHSTWRSRSPPTAKQNNGLSQAKPHYPTRPTATDWHCVDETNRSVCLGMLLSQREEENPLMQNDSSFFPRIPRKVFLTFDDSVREINGSKNLRCSQNVKNSVKRPRLPEISNRESRVEERRITDPSLRKSLFSLLLLRSSAQSRKLTQLRHRASKGNTIVLKERSVSGVQNLHSNQKRIVGTSADSWRSPFAKLPHNAFPTIQKIQRKEVMASSRTEEMPMCISSQHMVSTDSHIKGRDSSSQIRGPETRPRERLSFRSLFKSRRAANLISRFSLSRTGHHSNSPCAVNLSQQSVVSFVKPSSSIYVTAPLDIKSLSRPRFYSSPLDTSCSPVTSRNSLCSSSISSADFRRLTRKKNDAEFQPLRKVRNSDASTRGEGNCRGSPSGRQAVQTDRWEIYNPVRRHPFSYNAQKEKATEGEQNFSHKSLSNSLSFERQHCRNQGKKTVSVRLTKDLHSSGILLHNSGSLSANSQRLQSDRCVLGTLPTEAHKHQGCDTQVFSLRSRVISQRSPGHYPPSRESSVKSAKYHRVGRSLSGAHGVTVRSQQSRPITTKRRTRVFSQHGQFSSQPYQIPSQHCELPWQISKPRLTEASTDVACTMKNSNIQYSIKKSKEMESRSLRGQADSRKKELRAQLSPSDGDAKILMGQNHVDARYNRIKLRSTDRKEALMTPLKPILRATKMSEQGFEQDLGPYNPQKMKDHQIRLHSREHSGSFKETLPILERRYSWLSGDESGPQTSDPPRRKRTLYDQQTRALLRVGVRESEADDSAASGVDLSSATHKNAPAERMKTYSNISAKERLFSRNEGNDDNYLRSSNSKVFCGPVLRLPTLLESESLHSSSTLGNLAMDPTRCSKEIHKWVVLEEKHRKDTPKNSRRGDTFIPPKVKHHVKVPGSHERETHGVHMRKRYVDQARKDVYTYHYIRRAPLNKVVQDSICEREKIKEDAPRLRVPSRPTSPLWRSILEDYEEGQVEWPQDIAKKKRMKRKEAIQLPPTAFTDENSKKRKRRKENHSNKEISTSLVDGLSSQKASTYVQARRSLQARALLSPGRISHNTPSYSVHSKVHKNKLEIPTIQRVHRPQSAETPRPDDSLYTQERETPLIFADEPYLRFVRNLHRHSIRKSIENRKRLGSPQIATFPIPDLSCLQCNHANRLNLKEATLSIDFSERVLFEETKKEAILEETVVSAVPLLPLNIPLISLPPSNLELEFINFGYEHQHILSHGAAGCTHVVRAIDDGDLWVAKVVDLSRLTPQEVEMATLEAEYLQRLRHPFILRFKESFITPTSLIIITEYCQGGDMFSRVQRAVKLGQLKVDTRSVLCGKNCCEIHSTVSDTANQEACGNILAEMTSNLLNVTQSGVSDASPLDCFERPYLQEIDLTAIQAKDTINRIPQPLSPVMRLTEPSSPCTWSNNMSTQLLESCASKEVNSPLQWSADELQDDQIMPHQIVQWITQLALGLQYMHSQKILHCDLKSSNIFLTKDGTAKIGDLGIAREVKQEGTLTPQRCPRGTPIYMSPELCSGQELTDKADSWALGCVLYELVFRKHAFEDVNSGIGRRSLSGSAWTMSSTVGRVSLEIDRRIPEVQDEIRELGDLVFSQQKIKGVRRACQEIRNEITQKSIEPPSFFTSTSPHKIEQVEVRKVHTFPSPSPRDHQIPNKVIITPLTSSECGHTPLPLDSSVKTQPNSETPCSSSSNQWIDQFSPDLQSDQFSALLKKPTFERLLPSRQGSRSASRRRRRRSLTESVTERRSKRMRCCLTSTTSIRHSLSAEYCTGHPKNKIHTEAYSGMSATAPVRDLDIPDSQDWVIDSSVTDGSPWNDVVKVRPIFWSSSASPSSSDEEDGSKSEVSSDESPNAFSVRLIHHLLAALLQPDPKNRPSLHEVLEMLYSAEYLPDKEDDEVETLVNENAASDWSHIRLSQLDSSEKQGATEMNNNFVNFSQTAKSEQSICNELEDQSVQEISQTSTTPKDHATVPTPDNKNTFKRDLTLNLCCSSTPSDYSSPAMLSLTPLKRSGFIPSESPIQMTDEIGASYSIEVITSQESFRTSQASISVNTSSQDQSNLTPLCESEGFQPSGLPPLLSGSPPSQHFSDSQASTSAFSIPSRRLHVPLTRATKGLVSPQLRAVARYLHELPHRQVRLIHRNQNKSSNRETIEKD